MGNDTKPNNEGLEAVRKLTVESLRSPERVTEQVFKTTSVGSLATAIGDSFYGLNHRQTPGSISINKDYYGLTFFTRPRLNLTSDNLRAAPGPARVLTPLLTREAKSIQRIIRCTLDPELAKADGKAAGLVCPFVDRQQAFIPILTNNLLSISGWPDVQAPTFTSPDGVYKEAFSMVDGLTQNYSTYDITANFRNIPGDPISLLFFTWITYASLVFQGELVPYPDMIVNNEIDYNTRIYRLVLDSTKTRVQKIGACGAAFPLNAPLGGTAFNYEADRPINNANDQISISFRAMGANYQDDILIDEFNRTTALFNDAMKPKNFSRTTAGKDASGNLIHTYVNSRGYRLVPMEALSIFNNRGYPRIDPFTYELQWWVTPEDYQQRLPDFNYFKTLRESNG